MAGTITSSHPPECSIPAAVLNPKSEARTQLLTQVRLLHLLHHRSKNQHRRSIWYRHFNHFRREVNSLCVDLAINFGPGFPNPTSSITKPLTQRSNAKGKAKAKAKTTTPSSTAIPPAPNVAHATARLNSWLTRPPSSTTSASLLTQTYTSLTSLHTTPSFTPLALTLLAILARVCSITGLTAHLQKVGERLEAEEEERNAQGMGEMLERFAREDLGEVVGRVDVGPTKGVGEHDGAFGAVGRDDAGKFGDDVGVAVKRSAPPQMEVEDERKGNRHAEEPPTKKVKRKKKGSSIDDLFAGL